MNTTALILLIVAIVMIARHKRDRRYLEHRLSQREDLRGVEHSLPDTTGLEREVEELRDRVRVLERIVTEANSAEARESRRISDEIEALRDREHS